ncbi:MAG: hypothetical protein BWX80_01240 [Candidatus Hydrogenedentes bacterium ADurb.Bin101]|nr:MAG: hypothetical protein BWX80_01240 [Candidatus Hydrogenedentes bacterium ADurb.Bin101]
MVRATSGYVVLQISTERGGGPANAAGRVRPRLLNGPLYIYSLLLWEAMSLLRSESYDMLEI